uniref:Uncharacterized protein n=1 Tax=Siphoviridae sp. ctu9a31 TaxID=2825712 RepID=A0A8S5QBC8_9CAUD|nr:MAG TPA: hypothetical protein [Siphoviridae sp. ctu9a31]
MGYNISVSFRYVFFLVYPALWNVLICFLR